MIRLGGITPIYNLNLARIHERTQKFRAQLYADINLSAPLMSHTF